jgi:hypothetical protein
MDGIEPLKQDLWTRWEREMERRPAPAEGPPPGGRALYARVPLFDLKEYTPRRLRDYLTRHYALLDPVVSRRPASVLSCTRGLRRLHRECSAVRILHRAHAPDGRHVDDR